MISERDIVRLMKRGRRNLGLTQSDVVTRLQLAGFDVSVEVYKNIENNRRLLKVPEFLFLADLLQINVDAILAELPRVTSRSRDKLKNCKNRYDRKGGELKNV